MQMCCCVRWESSSLDTAAHLHLSAAARVRLLAIHCAAAAQELFGAHLAAAVTHTAAAHVLRCAAQALHATDEAIITAAACVTHGDTVVVNGVHGLLLWCIFFTHGARGSEAVLKLDSEPL